MKRLIQDTKEHELQSRKKEISSRTAKLRAQISTFRQDQKNLMRKVGDKVAQQSVAGPAIEDERLYLPSDLTEAERRQMKLEELGTEEIRWREGQAFDSFRALQNVVKALSALRNRKFKNDRQQKQNTRAGDHIDDAIGRRNQRMQAYNVARMAIISLKGSSDLPPMTEADLFMKSVQQKRHVGDSGRPDGLLWRATALQPNDGDDIEMGGPEEDESADDGFQSEHLF